jgi:hypothetical protein
MCSLRHDTRNGTVAAEIIELFAAVRMQWLLGMYIHERKLSTTFFGSTMNMPALNNHNTTSIDSIQITGININQNGIVFVEYKHALTGIRTRLELVANVEGVAKHCTHGVICDIYSMSLLNVICEVTQVIEFFVAATGDT